MLFCVQTDSRISPPIGRQVLKTTSGQKTLQGYYGKTNVVVSVKAKLNTWSKKLIKYGHLILHLWLWIYWRETWKVAKFTLHDLLSRDWESFSKCLVLKIQRIPNGSVWNTVKFCERLHWSICEHQWIVYSTKRRAAIVDVVLLSHALCHVLWLAVEACQQHV